MEEINGKYYPLWSQFVEKRKEFIGGVLQDFGDSMDRAISGIDSMTTEINDIKLRANGKDSAWFEISGNDFSCGFDVSCGGITAGDENDKGWLVFRGYGGHKFRIKKPNSTKDS